MGINDSAVQYENSVFIYSMFCKIHDVSHMQILTSHNFKYFDISICLVMKTELVEDHKMSRMHWLFSGLVLFCSIYCMSGVFNVIRRHLTTMASGHVAGIYSMAFVTVPNEEVASKLSRGLVEKKLAACVNIIPGIRSVYEWEGKIEEDGELLMMIKTRTSKISDVATFVRENHPYDVAEVISSPIENGNPPYLDWIGKSVPE